MDKYDKEIHCNAPNYLGKKVCCSVPITDTCKTQFDWRMKKIRK